MVPVCAGAICTCYYLTNRYLELFEMTAPVDHKKALDIMDTIPLKSPPDFEDAYVHGEMIRLLMKHKMYDDSRLEKNLIGYAKVNGLSSIEKEVTILDEAYKYSKLLMRIYATVNGKPIDDPELVDFFKVKCWI